MRILGLLIVLLAASTASATGGHKPDPKPAPKPAKTTTKASAAAYSASASQARAEQRQAVTTNSSDTYEAEQIPVNTAAELPPGFCTASGRSVGTSTVSVSVVDRDYICARLELFRAYLDSERGVQRVLAAIEVEQSAKPGLKGAAVAAETMRTLAAQVHKDAFEQPRLANERLGEDDTKVRSFFVRTLGSLPILNWLAPR